jgi:hypothetical protein
MPTRIGKAKTARTPDRSAASLNAGHRGSSWAWRSGTSTGTIVCAASRHGPSPAVNCRESSSLAAASLAPNVPRLSPSSMSEIAAASTPTRGRQATHNRSAAGAPRSPATKTSSMAAFTVGSSSSTHRLGKGDIADAGASQLAGRCGPAVTQCGGVVASRLVSAVARRSRSGRDAGRLGGEEHGRFVDQTLGHAARRLRSEADAPRGKVQTNPSTWNWPHDRTKASKRGTKRSLAGRTRAASPLTGSRAR